MIIDDLHKFFFVHIPKCARGVVQEFDTTQNMLAPQVDNHPDFIDDFNQVINSYEPLKNKNADFILNSIFIVREFNHGK